ncbi:hypothetical protein [Lysobacter gummosus]
MRVDQFEAAVEQDLAVIRFRVMDCPLCPRLCQPSGSQHRDGAF